MQTADLQKLIDTAKTMYNQRSYAELIAILNEKINEGINDPWIFALFGHSLFLLKGAEFVDISIKCIEQAIQADPEQAEFYVMYANLLKNCGYLVESINFLLKALELNPKLTALNYELAILNIHLGQPEIVSKLLLKTYQETNSVIYLATLMQYIYYDLAISQKEILKYSKELYKAYFNRYQPKIYDHDSNRFDTKKQILKIGFFSAHGLSDWAGVRCLCKFLDKSRFEIFGYSMASDKLPEYCNDTTSTYVQDIKSNVVAWHDCSQLAIKDIAEKVYQDQIDIFIDLAGFSAYDPNVEAMVGVAARKPAPVVATWLSSNGTTAFPSVDYFITSKHQVFPGDQNYFTETIATIDNALFQVQLEEVMKLPPIKDPPYKTNGYITFGSFHRHIKFTNNVYQAWVKILKAVPGSKLMLKYALLDNLKISEYILSRFKLLGIDESRIIMEGPCSKYDFQDAYNKIDIALDTFPYSGGTTTIDSIYMGVPVITNMADRPSSRVAAAILKTLGLDDLCCLDEKSYIAKAIELAADTSKIDFYRNNLRDIISKGKMRPEDYARAFADVLNYMWENSCLKFRKQN